MRGTRGKRIDMENELGKGIQDYGSDWVGQADWYQHRYGQG